MYDIQPTPYGYRLIFRDVVSEDEARQWLEYSKQVISMNEESFHVLVEMIGLRPVNASVQAIFFKGQSYYRQMGMVRSAVILSDDITLRQFQQIAQDTGIRSFERYISSSAENWQSIAMDWLLHGKEPEVNA